MSTSSPIPGKALKKLNSNNLSCFCLKLCLDLPPFYKINVYDDSILFINDLKILLFFTANDTSLSLQDNTEGIIGRTQEKNSVR